jgi:hypothetical protein
MHMPHDARGEELHGYMAPAWVAAHEIAGHFTDVNEEENQLSDTGLTLSNGARIYTTNDRHAETARQNYDSADAEEDSGLPSRYAVYRQVVDVNGEIVDMQHEVTDPPRESRFRMIRAIRRGVRAARNQDGMIMGDPRMTEAQLIRKETGHPTRYGSTNEAEHYAEAAASEVTQTEIPFSQAHDGEGINLRNPRFAQGYRVSTRDREMLAQRWGSDITDERSGVVFGEDHPVRLTAAWYGRPQDEPRLATIMDIARQTPLPEDGELLHIITGRRIGD